MVYGVLYDPGNSSNRFVKELSGICEKVQRLLLHGVDSFDTVNRETRRLCRSQLSLIALG
jgi:hypothetical protein